MQNLISLNLATADLTTVDGAIKTLEDKLTGLIDLSPEQRRSAVKMGEKSEAFCRKATEVLGQNPGVLPANFNLAEVKRDLAAFDALRPRLMRLARLVERLEDSQLALGSDVMSASLEGYAFLKIAGKGEGLDSLKRELSARFKSTKAKATEEGGKAEAVAQ